MFKEMLDKQLQEFYSSQTALFDALEGKGKDILSRIPKGLANFGEPPYFIDDGQRALLHVDALGSLTLLPFGFNLSEETVNEDFDQLYSFPVRGGTFVRLIPAKADIEIPVLESGEDEQSNIDNEYWNVVDTLFREFVSKVSVEAIRELAHDMEGYRIPVCKMCSESELSVDETIRNSVVAEIFHNAFAVAVSSAAEKQLKSRDDEGEHDDASLDEST